MDKHLTEMTLDELKAEERMWRTRHNDMSWGAYVDFTGGKLNALRIEIAQRKREESR